MATYDLTQGIPDKIVKGDILNCPYSGHMISLSLKKGTYKLECWGAQGGLYTSAYTNSGKGGYSIGYLKLSEDDNFYLYTGGYPGDSTAAGYNGGGYTNYYGGGGGGASDIRITNNNIYARVMVAGGGGGNGYSDGGNGGGYGGGLTGGKGVDGSANGGYGGTQTDGGSSSSGTGSFGQGGNTSAGGGGGGGWYGGGAGVSSGTDSAGGGGSGYVYTSETASNYPSGCLLDASSFLTDAQTVDGNTAITLPDGSSATGNSGNGYIRITVISTTTFYYKQNGTWIDGEKIYLKSSDTWTETESVDQSKFAKIILPIPQAYGSTSFEYDESTKSIQSRQYLPNYMSVTDNSSSIPGDHSAEYQFTNPKAEWMDNTKTNKNISWDIRMKKLQCNSLVSHTGSEVNPSITNNYPAYITLTGTTAATELGDYQFTATLNNGLKWVDGTSSPITYDWSIVNQIFKNIEFTQESDLDYFSKYTSSYAYITIENNDYAKFGTTKTDDTPYMYKNFDQTFYPFHIEVKYYMSNQNDFQCPSINVSTDNDGTYRWFYYLHDSGSWTSYLPGKTNNVSRLDHNNDEAEAYLYRGDLQTIGVWHTVIFDLNGGVFTVTTDDTQIYSGATTATCFTSLGLNVQSSWWQTQWNGKLDYVRMTGLSPSSYTVTFKRSHDDVVVSTQSVIQGSTASAITWPTIEGYVYSNYMYYLDSGTEVEYTYTKTIDSDLTVYGKYIASAGDKPINLNPSATYTGSEITNGYTCPSNVTMTGNDRGTEIGSYVAVYTPNEGYVWSDGTNNSVTVTLSIESERTYKTEEEMTALGYTWRID